MSCWVVPTIAAELWGVSVDHVLQQARDGHLPYCLDQGFMFVDVIGHGGGGGGALKPHEEHPPTFTVLSAAETEALCGGSEARDESLDEGDEAEDEDAETQSPDDDEASADLGDWRT